ncbi:MAG TPA: ABC transporter substrate-binding protein [bacterium]|nr:ABC transporter substrate-binding protein [bacterium]
MSPVITYDPGRFFEFVSAPIIANTYDTLVTYERENYTREVPRLAEQWTVSRNGRVYTFRLKRGVQFASGNEVTANDVVWSFQRLKNLKDNPSFLADSIAVIDAPDKYTVAINLRTPDITFLSRLTAPQFSVLDSKTVAAHGGTDGSDAAKGDTATPWLNAHSAGSGPWMLTSYSPYQRAVLEPNPHYARGTVYGGNVIFLHAKEPAARLLAFRSRRAQIALGLPIQQAIELKRLNGVHILAGKSFNAIYVGMTTKPEISRPLSDPRVRTAVRYAVDEDGIVDGMLQGQSEKPATPIPVGILGSDQIFNDRIRIRRDIAKAKELLRAAGYPTGFAVTMSYPGGTVDYGVSYDALAPKIAADLSEAGISVKLDPGTRPKVLAAYRAGSLPMVLFILGLDYIGPSEPAEFVGPGGAVARRLGFEDPQLHQLIAGAFDTISKAKFVESYREIIQRELANGPFAVVAQPKLLIPVWDVIQGDRFSAIASVDLTGVAVK